MCGLQLLGSVGEPAAVAITPWLMISSGIIRILWWKVQLLQGLIDGWFLDDGCLFLASRKGFSLPLLSSEAYSGQQEGFRRPLPVGLLLRINYQMMGKLYSGVVRQTTVLRHLVLPRFWVDTWTFLAISHRIAPFRLDMASCSNFSWHSSKSCSQQVLPFLLVSYFWSGQPPSHIWRFPKWGYP